MITNRNSLRSLTTPIATMLACAGLTMSVLALPALRPLDASGRITYFISDGEKGSGVEPRDPELATWALKAWERILNGALRFEPSPRDTALVRVFWVSAQSGQYGEAQATNVNGHPGAAAFIRPDTTGLGPDIAILARNDALFRDTVVYLTCLHELGHTIGLLHTSNYDDVMYAFGYGGDVPEFFMRYRRQLRTREDIPRVSGLSPSDIASARALYKK